MNPEKLLDAIGMLDDRHFEPETKTQIINYRRRFVVLIAAVLTIFLLVGTALAVSPDLRNTLFSILAIETPERPPINSTDTLPTEGGSSLHKINTVHIDEVVSAHYFTGGTVRGGALYTSSHRNDNAVPTDGQFWEIRKDGIVAINTTRIDFPLAYGDRTFQIIFDYAILNQELCIQVWPQDLDKNPIGNGWNLVAIGDRTDVALLSVPVDTGGDYTHDYLLLDLRTLETRNLLDDIPHDNIIIDACWFTDDLRYAIAVGYDKENDEAHKFHTDSWFCDLDTNTMETFHSLTGANIDYYHTLNSPYFLDNSTIIYLDMLSEENFHVISYDIPTGVQTTIVQNTTKKQKEQVGYQAIQAHGAHGAHGLLFKDDGTVDLIDLRTQAVLNMQGLNTDKLHTYESPDGSRILIAYTKANENSEYGYGYANLGILNPETGVLLMLSRDNGGNQESFVGWLDNDTIVIRSYDDAWNSYVYVYEFHEPPA